MNAKTYKIYADVKVVEWGGDGADGYETLKKNVASNIYNETSATVTKTAGA